MYGFSKLAALERLVEQDAIGIEETISLGGLCRVTRHKNHRKRILVAEDNAINQRLLEALLVGAGHEFDIVDNGVKAVEAVKGQLYDLVLMDVNMPEMGGIEATTRIRELPGENGTTPVIAVTAGAMREDREKCFAAGTNDYIGKPIDQRILFEKIAQWTGTDTAGAVAKPDVGNVGEESNTTEKISEDTSAALANLLGTIDSSIDKSE